MLQPPPPDADFWTWMAHPIWRYSAEPEAAVYSWFNVAEALAWWGIAGYALIRYVRCRRSRVEPLYIALLLVFGLSDVVESTGVTAWLVLCKGLIFSNLVVTRLYLVRVFYPDHAL